MNNKDLTNEFKRLFGILSSDRFLKMEGLSGEVPFYISHFSPELQNEADLEIDYLLNKLKRTGVSVLNINLYDLCLKLLEEEGDLEFILENEATMPKHELLSEIQNYLEVSNMHSFIMPKIKECVLEEQYDVIFFTGVGLVFPYIRSHNILNNLQIIIKDKPVVMFFPGEYRTHEQSGSSLNLFGRLLDDKYYRATDLNSYKI